MGSLLSLHKPTFSSPLMTISDARKASQGEDHMTQIVKALIVTDAGGGFLPWTAQPLPDARSTALSRAFHLGEFLRVLTNTAWVGFNLEITRAHRMAPGVLTEAAIKARTGADIVGFRFNQTFAVNGVNHTIADYDMVLFFSIDRGDPDNTLQAEADAIAQFMENGGGFFATGDHENLGSPLCGIIPRVRSMRRWWFDAAPPADMLQAPDALSSDRIDTTRVGADGVGNFEDQSDQFAQQISPTLYSAGFTTRFGYVAKKSLPHPLLCSPQGIVRFLPDHMHEGMCDVPANPGARNFTVNGVSVREYPDYTPSGGSAAPLSPEIVAYGTVIAGTTSPELDSAAHTGGDDPATGRTFGIIGAWDGHRVGKGRVVVDSTWHHFFDINLTGDRFLEDDALPSQHDQKQHGFYVPDGMGGRVPVAEYQMIMWYFRNIIYWLIPASRGSFIWWDTLYEAVQRPRLWEETMGLRDFERFHLRDYLLWGQLAEQYLSQVRGHCASYLIHIYLYKEKIPWWEWIQRYIDVWSPREKIDVRGILREQQWMGAQGISARPELAATIGLGAALATAAMVRNKLGDKAFDGHGSGKAGELMHGLMPKVLNHAAGQYAQELDRAAKTQDQLREVVQKQLQF
jgi:hypothetical protein